MTIDPLKQQATVDQQRSTEAQKKAILDYNQQGSGTAEGFTSRA